MEDGFNLSESNIPNFISDVKKKTKKETAPGKTLSGSEDNQINSTVSKDSIPNNTENVNKQFLVSDKSITDSELNAIQGIGRKNVNDFTTADIKKTERFARRYFEEMGVKSPFFRAWFGDWRAYDNTEIDTINKKGNMRGKCINIDTGWEIIISRKIAKETLHQSSKSINNAVKYLPYIEDITQNSVLLISEISDKENNLSVMFHTFYAYTEAMGYPALLKLRVEELVNEKDGNSIRRDYLLQTIEEEPLSERNRFSKPNRNENNSSIISISDLVKCVKTKDKNYNPKPVDPVLLNADGTPKVFYHGTSEAIAIEDNGLSRSKMTKRALITKNLNRRR
ncbi:MAG: hypothetical protein Q4B40_06885 [Clostridia bacterium]|nr:hypothetical protein [Clostridia bacterium]